jgi:phthalate 4,5-dioxygenase oxygenase subunit
MLTQAENELITRVGKGTPMGELMRRFWFPIFKSERLLPSGRPQRVRLLGENYVLFRAADGRVGLFAEACPHRGASLVLGHVDDCGIRCLFHSWKIDVSGKVVDVPSEPSQREVFGEKVRVRHFPTREAGTLIWAFVGEGEPTQFPDFPFTHVPDSQVTVLDIPVECNWLQGLEVQLDSSHVGLLHKSTITSLTTSPSPSLRNTNEYFLRDPAPRYETATTPYGLRAVATRAKPGKLFSRVTEFCMPSWACIPGPEDQDVTIIAQTPVDDTHTIQYFVMFNFTHPIETTGIGHGLQLMLDYDGSSFSKLARPENNWGQSTTMIQNGHWTGMRNVLYEDFAIAESQGPIVAGPTKASVRATRRSCASAA